MTTSTTRTSKSTPATTEQINSLFLSQLRDLSESISGSFKSISTSLDTLKDHANKITLIAADLNHVLETKNKSSSSNDQLSTADIDNSLMILAQQAQDGLKSASTGEEGDPTVSAAPSTDAPASSITATKTSPLMKKTKKDVNNNNALGVIHHHNLSPEIPEIDLNPRAKTVADLWIEWNHGYREQPSLRSLENQYGTKWRRGRIAKSAQRRKKVVEFIESEYKRNPSNSLENVVDLLENYRIKKNKGLFWLYGSLPNHLYHSNGQPIEFHPDGDDESRHSPVESTLNSSVPTSTTAATTEDETVAIATAASPKVQLKRSKKEANGL